MSNKPWDNWQPGILTRGQLKKLVEHNVISGASGESDISSIDLHLSKSAWELKGSLKLHSDESFTSITKSKRFVGKKRDLSKSKVLKSGHTYVIQLQEEIRSDHDNLELHGMATGRSSIGRLDVLTRLISDNCEHYDKLEANQNEAQLYVEVTPITFPIRVKEGLALNQLRLFKGKPEYSVISDESVHLYKDLITNPRDNVNELSLDLTPVRIGNRDVFGFTTQKGPYKQMDAIDLGSKQKADPSHYWSTLGADAVGGDSLLIKKGHFYILRSKQRFRLPHNIGVYCKAITEHLGEIRVHYAGFVHPVFGYYRPKKQGTPLMFEIRGHTVDAFLRDDELMAKLEFYRASEPVKLTTDERREERTSLYQNQTLRLSSYFDQEKWESST